MVCLQFSLFFSMIIRSAKKYIFTQKQIMNQMINKNVLEKTPITSLKEFEDRYNEICWKINAVIIAKDRNKNNVIWYKWVTFGGLPVGDATPLVDYGNGKFKYVVSERGHEFERIESSNPYEIMFHIFCHITHEMASNYELKNRISDQDFRRIMFSKQLEILGLIDFEWRIKYQEHLDKILKEHPYNDTI